MSFTTDVAVVGGGVAGLAAADELSARGHDVVLLEAAERLGGRVYTRHLEGWPGPVELGAELVHGAAREVHELARAAGAHVDPVRATQWVATPQGLAPATDGWQAAIGRLADPVAHDVPVALHIARAGLSSELDRSLRGYVAGFYAARLTRASAAAVAELEAASEPGLGRVREG